MNRSKYLLLGLLSACVWLGVETPQAQACPSCKDANASDNRLPLAYQASILFMLAVPAGLATTLGILLYRLNKQQEAAAAAFESGDVWLGDALPEQA